MFRFFSKRLSRRGQSPKNSDVVDGSTSKKKLITCKIQMLDNTEMIFNIPKKSLGHELYERVFFNLNIVEKSYFGIRYLGENGIRHWLNQDKKVKSQIKGKPPYNLTFNVKFFVLEPRQLLDEITKYQFYLQVKKNIASGDLKCPYDTCVILCALVIQSELGDFDADNHFPATISEFRFCPEQSEEMEQDIFEKFKELRGYNPAQAEMKYLELAKNLDMYGADLHKGIGEDGGEYQIGLTPIGVTMFEDNEIVGNFWWQNILKIDFSKKKLRFLVLDDEDNEVRKDFIFQFTFKSSKVCKFLWESTVEWHSFYRLIVVSTKKQSRKQNFFRTTSKFTYTGKTAYQASMQRKVRRATSFERNPSQRFAPRKSHLLRENRRNELRALNEELKFADKNSTATASKQSDTDTETEIMTSETTDSPTSTSTSSSSSPSQDRKQPNEHHSAQTYQITAHSSEEQGPEGSNSDFESVYATIEDTNSFRLIGRHIRSKSGTSSIKLERVLPTIVNENSVNNTDEQKISGVNEMLDSVMKDLSESIELINKRRSGNTNILSYPPNNEETSKPSNNEVQSLPQDDSTEDINDKDKDNDSINDKNEDYENCDKSIEDESEDKIIEDTIQNDDKNEEVDEDNSTTDVPVSVPLTVPETTESNNTDKPLITKYISKKNNIHISLLYPYLFENKQALEGMKISTLFETDL